VDPIVHALIGDPSGAVDAAIKASTLFLTAAVLFRFTERRTLAEFAPFDWIAAVAAGAIVGRLLPPAIPRGSTQPWSLSVFSPLTQY
jgi:hypothetical protein